MSRSVLVCLLSLAAPLPVVADDAWPVTRGPSREPAPYKFDLASVKKLPSEFLDDSVATILYAGTTHLVEADGTIETITHEVTRLNGRKAVEKLGEFRNMVFAPNYQKLTLNEARVHKPDGKVVRVLPRHVHLRDVGTDYQTYDPEKQLIITFPSLETGDTIEVKWTVRGKNPEHDGQFFNRYSLGDPTYPVVLDEYRVRVAKGKALKHASVNAKLTPTVTDAAGDKLYLWKLTHLPRGPRDENLPSREELRPTVIVSTFANWDDVGKWKHKLRAPCWECTADVKKTVAEVTRGLKAPAEKARALTYWVRKQVRYLSTGERHDYTPHKPGEVIANRYGDCKDTSQLLAVMLREAGIQVELATLGTLDDGQVHPDVPSPWGTHAILCVTIDGKPHWVDTTTRLAGWDQLPRDDMGRLCYLTDDKGKLRLLRTPVMRPEHFRTEQVTEVGVRPDGTSENKRVVVSSGSAAMRQRDRLVEVPAGEQRQQLTSELQDANSRSRLVDFTVDRRALADYDRPVKLTMMYEIQRHFDGKPELEGSVTDSMVWGRFLAYNLDPDRKVPMVLPTPFESLHTYRFTLPPTYANDFLPRSRKLSSRWGRFEVKARSLDPDSEATRRIEITFHFRLEQPRVEVADFAAFRKFHDAVMSSYRAWVTMKPVRSLSAAPLLEEWFEASPQNSEVAAALARVYLRNDKPDEARRVLERACHYAPEVEALWDLRVEAARSPAEEEEAQRERLRRFPRHPQNGIDTASILISRGKQAEARKLLEPLSTAGSPTERARVHYQLARSHYREHKLEQALKHLDLAAKQDADVVNTPRGLRLRAQALDELNRPAESLAVYRKVWEKDPTSHEVMLSLIRLSLATKDQLGALNYLRRYTLAASRDASGLALAAETYFKLGRLDEALEVAQRSRELRFHEKAQRVLGLVYLVRGDDAAAVRHLEKAEPDAVVVAAWIDATIHLGAVGELDGLLRKAARIDRQTDELKQAIARARAVLKRRSDLARQAAVPTGKEAAVSAPLDALACAEWLHQAGRPTRKVERLLAAALKSPVPLGPAIGLRATLALDRGQLRAALADAEKAIELSPAAPAGHYARGKVRQERGTAGALGDLQQAVKLTGRQDATYLLGLAEALAEAGRSDEARRAAQEGLRLRPDHVALRELVGRLEGNVKKAG